MHYINRPFKIFVAASLTLVALSTTAAQAPRLVLQITVDALRGDLPQHYLANMGEGGFRYLFNNGVYYSNANYEHGNTETIVGHSSLATGTTPALHGMVGNVWFDKGAQRLIYNVEDSRYHLLSSNADVDKSTEIDPTQRTAKADGRSPRALLTSTFSDELAYAYNGAAKIFAVSVKDRGAIPMAGQTGKAFWFSKAAGEFITSNYYYDSYPKWVLEWNSTNPTAAYSGKAWELLKPLDQYLHAEVDDQPWETDFPGFGRVFPHPWGASGDKYFTTRLTLSPAGDRLTLDFAKALISNEQLGQDAIPDYLSVSFSSNDYVLHVFGPSSLETEDSMLQLDRTLAELLAYVDQTVGLKNTLIVLSADHGAPDAPPFFNQLGNHNAHYFDMNECLQAVEAAGLGERFGTQATLIKDYSHPYVYLDTGVIKRESLNRQDVATAVAAEFRRCRGVNEAITAHDTASSPTRNPLVETRVWNNYNLGRSGDIYVVLNSGVYVNDFDGLIVASVHGSPWNYDTFVPIFFAGPGIKAGAVSRPVTPYDIAPTLSAKLGINRPSGAIGHPLEEALAQ
jgi:predicted AlkP superfamily pyrophosphatase or phosphodiesterase